jgi:saxitoxin biosynthesis operon SxtJ-like protein
MTRTPLKEERSFGWSVGAVLAVIGALQWWRGRPLAAEAFGVIGVALLVAAAAAPAALVVPNRWWRRFAHVLGWINARVLLTLFFVLVLTPAGTIMRLLGRDPLARRDRGSSWVPYGDRVRDPQHFERLF